MRLKVGKGLRRLTPLEKPHLSTDALTAEITSRSRCGAFHCLSIDGVRDLCQTTTAICSNRAWDRTQGDKICWRICRRLSRDRKRRDVVYPHCPQRIPVAFLDRGKRLVEFGHRATMVCPNQCRQRRLGA